MTHPIDYETQKTVDGVRWCHSLALLFIAAVTINDIILASSIAEYSSSMRGVNISFAERRRAVGGGNVEPYFV